VFYVPKTDVKGKNLLFEQAFKEGFEVLNATIASNGYKCSNDQFQKDPTPGIKKHCFCD
jgi:hypothetical protein